MEKKKQEHDIGLNLVNEFVTFLRVSHNLIIPHNINDPKHTLEYIVIVYPAR